MLCIKHRKALLGSVQMNSSNTIDVPNKWVGWHLENGVFLSQGRALATISQASSRNDMVQPRVCSSLDAWLKLTTLLVTSSLEGVGGVPISSPCTSIHRLFELRGSGERGLNSDFLRRYLFPGKLWSCICRHWLGGNSFLTKVVARSLNWTNYEWIMR